MYGIFTYIDEHQPQVGKYAICIHGCYGYCFSSTASLSFFDCYEGSPIHTTNSIQIHVYYKYSKIYHSHPSFGNTPAPAFFRPTTLPSPVVRLQCLAHAAGRHIYPGPSGRPQGFTVGPNGWKRYMVVGYYNP